ncbi:double-strand break repair protein MRE11 [Plasmodium brasilianum]|uniref:Double-strand break repair protein MRE11, putative n=3 Tax=Plasmodium (Plasmodium) TaxID=418103 RepID=A0A1D3JKN0_PLAMA|nr:double-strand break repair protein MRE11, putative [Plasmodium malariae]KAI4840920.1 double-strand break repair protein MRE11 [Plasmodium brasilianum]SBT87115.1 double-strand break repair protein MRE11, putative [Plasmodium malariae]
MCRMGSPPKEGKDINIRSIVYDKLSREKDSIKEILQNGANSISNTHYNDEHLSDCSNTGIHMYKKRNEVICENYKNSASCNNYESILNPVRSSHNNRSNLYSPMEYETSTALSNEKRARVISVKSLYSTFHKTSDILLNENGRMERTETTEKEGKEYIACSGNNLLKGKAKLQADHKNENENDSANKNEYENDSVNKNENENDNANKNEKDVDPYFAQQQNHIQNNDFLRKHENYYSSLAQSNEDKNRNRGSKICGKKGDDVFMNSIRSDKEDDSNANDLHQRIRNSKECSLLLSSCDTLHINDRRKNFTHNDGKESPFKKIEMKKYHKEENKSRRNTQNCRDIITKVSEHEKDPSHTFTLKELAENEERHLISSNVPMENTNITTKENIKLHEFEREKMQKNKPYNGVDKEVLNYSLGSMMDEKNIPNERREKKYNFICEEEGKRIFKNIPLCELKVILSENEPNTLKILLCTDNHLGYKENNAIQKEDTFNSFEEILFIAKKLNVDMILNSGDLFHKNKLSEYTLFKTMSTIRKYCHVSRKDVEIGSSPPTRLANGESKNMPSRVEETPTNNDDLTRKDKYRARLKEIRNYNYEYYKEDKMEESFPKNETYTYDEQNSLGENKKEMSTGSNNSESLTEGYSTVEKPKKKRICPLNSYSEGENSAERINDSSDERYCAKRSAVSDRNRGARIRGNSHARSEEEYYDEEERKGGERARSESRVKRTRGESLESFKLCSVNEKFEKSIPFFTVHGNHDYPYSYDYICPLDILNISNLINYIGKNSLNKIVVKPILLNKNSTKISIYAIGWIKDERLYRSFENKQVKFVLPLDYKRRINILVLHQNRYIRNSYGNNTKNFIKESFIPKFMDLVIWGHEHFSKPYLEESLFNSFYNLQLGSSVRTSLCANEYGDKYIGLLEIKKERFRFLKINLETVRPFEMKDIRLSDYNLNFKEESILNKFLHEQTSQILNKIKENFYEQVRKYYLFRKLFFPSNDEDNLLHVTYENKKKRSNPEEANIPLFNENIEKEITTNDIFEKSEKEREKYFYSILREQEINNFYDNLKNEDFYSSTFIHLAFSDYNDTFDLLKIKKYVYDKPLLKLKVEYNEINIINTQLFGSTFAHRIANPSEFLSFYKKKLKMKDTINTRVNSDEQDNVDDKDILNMEYINEYNKVFDILFDYCDVKNKLLILDQKIIMNTVQNFILNNNSSFNSDSINSSEFTSFLSMVENLSKNKIDLLELNLSNIPVENMTDDYLVQLTEKLSST